jgi:hypothetical protein
VQLFSNSNEIFTVNPMKNPNESGGSKYEIVMEYQQLPNERGGGKYEIVMKWCSGLCLHFMKRS